MTTQELSSRLRSLSEAHRETIHLISRLSKLPTQPGSGSPDISEGDARVELSDEIHQSLKEQEEDLELARQEVEDFTNSSGWVSSARRRESEKDKDRVALIAQVERLGEEQKQARTQFRKAQLQAKRNAEAAKREERELLFAGVQEGGSNPPLGRRKGQEKFSQDELLVNASSDVTAALRRTQQLMQSELSRSQFAHDTLQESTNALSSLNESYNTLDTLLSSSRSLVSTLIHSQKSDTWYLETAFYILIATISWLVFRRLIYGPGWWLLYLPTKLFFRFVSSLIRVSFGAFAALAGALGGASQSTALSKIAERAPTSLVVKPSATGGIPRFSTAMAAPSIRVGGGGEGAKAVNAGGEEAPSQSEGSRMSEQVGKMAEESRRENLGETRDSSDQAGQQGTILQERSEDDGPPNPKKRMWEEKNEPPQSEGARLRDEL